MKLQNKIERTPEVGHKHVTSIYSISMNLVVFLMLPFLLGSCEAIAGIFKAGMGVGVFLVIAVILAIVFLFTRMGKNKNS
jgi:hypothetical protein